MLAAWPLGLLAQGPGATPPGMASWTDAVAGHIAGHAAPGVSRVPALAFGAEPAEPGPMGVRPAAPGVPSRRFTSQAAAVLRPPAWAPASPTPGSWSRQEGEDAPGRNVFKDFGGGVVGLGKDALDFVTAPFHLDRRQAIELGAVVAVGGLLFAFDQEVHDFVLRTQNDAPWSTLLDVGVFFEPLGLMNNTNPYWLAGIGVTYAFKQEPLMRVFQQLLFSHLISGATMGVARPLVGRERPRDADNPYEFNFGEGTSFPSGHTSTIFELARVLTHHIHFWPVEAALWGVAGSVAYQRLAAEFDEEAGELAKGSPHWPSDVWFGAWWGLAVANIVIRNDQVDDDVHVTTGVDAATGAFQLGVHVRF